MKQKQARPKEGMMELESLALLLPKLITSIFISADKSLLDLAEKFKLLQILRYLLALSLYSFRFFLRFLPYRFPSLTPSSPLDFPLNSPVKTDVPPPKGDSAIARALSQIFSFVNEVPVSSRKYETVRCLAETLIDDNLRVDSEVLRDVNRTALSTAFSRTLAQLEASMLEQDRERSDGPGGFGPSVYMSKRILRAVRSFGDVGRFRFGGSTETTRPAGSAEKFAAELLWFAQKLAACGSAEEAVSMWGSASNLAWLALSAEPRLQESLVKVSAFLFKQAKEMGGEEGDESKIQQHRQTRMDMLMSWLPFLCRASNGTDMPVFSTKERMEVEGVLEEIIEMLKQEEEQEKVLALWLHHFISCSTSDWPNLHACYLRWCNASRMLLVVQ